MSTNRRRSIGTLGAASLVLACSLVAGCTNDASISQPTTPASSSSTPATPPPVSPSDSPTPSTTEDVAVLAAYRGFWAAQVATLNHPSKKPPATLARYAIDKAYAGVTQSLLLYRSSGIANRGTPILDPRIEHWSTGTPPTATIMDCVDSSAWQPVYVKTGKPAAAPGQQTRVIVESTVTRYDDRWVVRTSTAHRDQPC